MATGLEPDPRSVGNLFCRSYARVTPLWLDVKGKMNGFAALDIHPHRRYDANKTAAGLTCCRTVITSLYSHPDGVYTEFGVDPSALGLDSHYHLLKPEFGCSRKRVHREMRLSGIASVRRWAYKVTTNSRHSHPVASNLLFFEQPNQAWGRYYLHSHRRGLALSGHHQELVYLQKGGLCLFQCY